MGVEQSGSPAIPRLDLGEALLEYTLQPDEFVGTRLLASARVDRKTGQFQKITRESLLRKGTNVKRSAGARYERDDFETAPVNYSCQERGHENALDQSIINLYAHDFDAEMHAAKLEARKVALDQEVDIAAAAFNTVTFTTGNGLRTDVLKAWSDPTSTIVADVMNAKEAIALRTGEEANTLLVNRTEYRRLLLNDEIVDALKTTSDKTIEARRKILAELFEVENILVGRAVFNSAKKGVTPAVVSKVWGDGFALLAKCANPDDPLTVPCFGRSIFWITDADTDAALIEEYPEPQTRSKVFRARSHADEVINDAFYAQLLDIAG